MYSINVMHMAITKHKLHNHNDYPLLRIQIDRAPVKIFRVLVVIHISNMGTSDLLDIYALSPRASAIRMYISGKSLVPMSQLCITYISHCVTTHAYTYTYTQAV